MNDWKKLDKLIENKTTDLKKIETKFWPEDYTCEEILLRI